MITPSWFPRLLLATLSGVLLLLSITTAVPAAFAATASAPTCGTTTYSIGITPTLVHNVPLYGDLPGYRVSVDHCTLAYLTQGADINQVHVNTNGNLPLPVITVGSHTLLDDATIVKQTVRQNAQTLQQISQTCPSHQVDFEMIGPAEMYRGTIIGSIFYQMFIHGQLEPSPRSIVCG
jgi:hypothetical protein